MSRNLLTRIACYVVSAALLLGAAAYLARGEDRALGVFLILVAAVISRVLVLNIAIPLEQQRGSDSAGDSTESTGESAR